MNAADHRDSLFRCSKCGCYKPASQAVYAAQATILCLPCYRKMTGSEPYGEKTVDVPEVPDSGND